MPRQRETARHRAQLRQARAYVRRHYRDPDLTLTDVAAAVGVSARQVQRIFRDQAGEEFRGYRLRVRMERARALLTREPNPLPVRVVANRVGYRQASGLGQAFVRIYGHTPSEIQPAGPAYYADIEYYLDRIEHVHNDRRELESIRKDLRRDMSISDDKRRTIEERIDWHLAGLNH